MKLLLNIEEEETLALDEILTGLEYPVWIPKNIPMSKTTYLIFSMIYDICFNLAQTIFDKQMHFRT
ncbi:hypothetical protein GCM10028791_28290 [Echinicola sediminis]